MDAAGADAADDDKHGTQDSPFLTIKRAVDAAVRDKDANIGAKIIIAPGIYRESIEVPPPAHADTDAPLVIEAAERDQTIIDGAEIDKHILGETWKREGPAGIYTWTGSTVIAGDDVAHRSPLLILDGLVLRQMDPAATLLPGTFSVAETKGSKKPESKLRLLPPEDMEITSSSVFQLSTRTSGVTISSRRSVVVRGLMIQHASTYWGTPTGIAQLKPAGVRIIDCTNILIEDTLSQWNDGPGLYVVGQGSGR